MLCRGECGYLRVVRFSVQFWLSSLPICWQDLCFSSHISSPNNISSSTNQTACLKWRCQPRWSDKWQFLFTCLTSPEAVPIVGPTFQLHSLASLRSLTSCNLNYYLTSVSWSFGWLDQSYIHFQFPSLRTIHHAPSNLVPFACTYHLLPHWESHQPQYSWSRHIIYLIFSGQEQADWPLYCRLLQSRGIHRLYFFQWYIIRS